MDMRVKLSEICDVRDGTHDSPNYVPKGYPLVTSKNIVNGTLDLSSVNYITKYDYDKINVRSKVDIGDVIMPMIGTIGNPYIVSDFNEFAIKNVALIKFPNKNVNNKYIWFFLNSNAFIRYINESNKGGAQKFLSLKDIRNMPIFLPSFEEQVNIVNKLDIIYSIINNHQQQLDKLDELVKARFVETFGDVVSNTKNWKTYTWNDVLVIKNGKNQKNVENNKGIYPICGSGGIMSYADDYITESNSVIIGRKGNINNPILMREKFWNVDTAFGLEPNTTILNVDYLFMFCSFFDFEVLNKAVTIPSLTKADLLRIIIPIPPIELQNQFADFVKQIDKSKVAVQKALDEAQLLFDSLMQEYFG